MTKIELNNILDKHKKWLNADVDGECAYLREADLRGAYLRKADLRKADLRGVNLRGADLREADLREANLRGAYLREADLHGADLRGAKYIPDYVCPISCPQEGSFIGFKKARIIIEACGFYQNVIVKLRITDDAKRSSATTRKCRCNKAEVISITSIDGNTEFKEAYSIYDKTFIYKTGEVISVDDFDEDRWN